MNKTQRIARIAGNEISLPGSDAKLVFSYSGGSKYRASNVVHIGFETNGVRYTTYVSESFAGGRTSGTEVEHFVPWDDIRELEVITINGVLKQRIVLHS